MHTQTHTHRHTDTHTPTYVYPTDIRTHANCMYTISTPNVHKH